MSTKVFLKGPIRNRLRNAGIQEFLTLLATSLYVQNYLECKVQTLLHDSAERAHRSRQGGPNSTGEAEGSSRSRGKEVPTWKVTFGPSLRENHECARQIRTR